MSLLDAASALLGDPPFAEDEDGLYCHACGNALRDAHPWEGHRRSCSWLQLRSLVDALKEAEEFCYVVRSHRRRGDNLAGHWPDLDRRLDRLEALLKGDRPT